MKHILKLTFVVVVTLLLASCGSNRWMERSPRVGGLSGKAYTEKVIELSPNWECVTGKVALALDMGAKGTTKVNATLRMKRGEVIQFSVAPLLGIEVVRMEISPQGILVLDRLNKRYVQASFEQVNNWARTDLSFHVLQSLFFNELFLPDRTQLTADDASLFRISVEGDNALLEAKSSKVLTYSFRASADSGLLQESRIGVKGTGYTLNWKYDDFQRLDARPFPQHMGLTIGGVKPEVALDMKLSRLSVDNGWESHTNIPSRYKKIEVEELVKMLLK